MTRVLYEAKFEFHLAYIIPVIIIAGTSLFPYIIRKSPEYKKTVAGTIIINIFCWNAVGFVALISLIAFLGQAHMYKSTVGAYKEGNYEIVEGYVEDFVPGADKREESFEIDGVCFSYSDYVLIQGYNATARHNGVIRGNGQHLRIGYVCYDESNVIVYIEELI